MLGCLLGCPTVVEIAGEPRLVARLRLGDFGLLLSEGALALGMDPDANECPEWGDDAFYDWLTGAGVGLFLWCVLRRDAPGLTPAGAEAIAGRAEPGDIALAYRAAMRRRAGDVAGGGRKGDLSAHRWGRTIKILRAAHAYAAIAELTLDQYDLEQTKAEDADAEAREEGAAVREDAHRAWLALHAARSEGAAQPEPASTPESPGPAPPGISPEVAADVRRQGYDFLPEVDDAR